VTTCEPDEGRVPDHAPDAVHDCAFTELHVKVVGMPGPVLSGYADRETLALPVTVYVTGMVTTLPSSICAQSLSSQRASCTESE
jgi:hypothetical protein